jgi:hypothetical protein
VRRGDRLLRVVGVVLDGPHHLAAVDTAVVVEELEVGVTAGPLRQAVHGDAPGERHPSAELDRRGVTGGLGRRLAAASRDKQQRAAAAERRVLLIAPELPQR